MHPLIIPLGLLLLGSLRGKGAANSGTGPQPTPPPGGPLPPRPRPKLDYGPAYAPKPTPRAPDYGKPYAPVPVTIEHPDVTPATQDAGKQAAVDAAVSQAIRADDAARRPMPLPPPEPEGARTPKQAAGELQQFLIKTGRFGSKKDRPAEVIAAQRDLGVKPDGIVGPKTRAAARKQGVALPPVK